MTVDHFRFFAVLFVLAFGLSIGSFLNVVIWRLPRKESLVRPALALSGLRGGHRLLRQHSGHQLRDFGRTLAVVAKHRSPFAIR